MHLLFICGFPQQVTNIPFAVSNCDIFWLKFQVIQNFDLKILHLGQQL